MLNFPVFQMKNKLLAFEFIYGKLGLGRDILPLELCMEHAALYIPDLPPEINFMIGQYVYPPRSINNAIQQQNLHSLLKEFQQRKPKLFSFYLEKIFHRLKFPHHPTLQYGAFVTGIKILNKTHMSPLMMLKSIEFRQVHKILQIRQVILYLCSYDRGEEIILQYTDDHLNDDKEVVLAAVKRNIENFDYASSRLKVDEDIILAVNSHPRKKQFYSQEEYEDYPWEDTFHSICRSVLGDDH